TLKERERGGVMERVGEMEGWVGRLPTVCWLFWVPLFAVNEHVMLWGLHQKRLRNDGFSHWRRGLPSLVAVTLYICGGLALTVTGQVGVVLELLAAVYLYMMLIEYFNLPHHLFSPIENRQRS